MSTTKTNPDTIARAALDLLGETGLDGLTMRVVATRLGMQPPALYWHVKNKQHLLDVMADTLYRESVAGLEAPRRHESWEEWLAARARQLRSVLLRYRDGARVYAGSNVTSPELPRSMELVLRTLQDAGFTPAGAARGVGTLLHFTVGCTIEEQARLGTAYGADNPYPGRPGAVDAERYPLTAAAIGEIFAEPGDDADFEHGLRLVLSGMAAALPSG